jgi:hypothetical protein
VARDGRGDDEVRELLTEFTFTAHLRTLTNSWILSIREVGRCRDRAHHIATAQVSLTTHFSGRGPAVRRASVVRSQADGRSAPAAERER